MNRWVAFLHFALFALFAPAVAAELPETILQSGIEPRAHYDDHRFFSISADHRILLLGCGPDTWIYDLAARKIIHQHTASGANNLSAVIDPTGRFALFHRNLGHGYIAFVVRDIVSGLESTEEAYGRVTLRAPGNEGTAFFHFDELGVDCAEGRVVFQKFGMEGPEVSLGQRGQHLRWDRFNQLTLRQNDEVVDSFSLKGSPSLVPVIACGGHYLGDGRLVVYGITSSEFLAVDVFGNQEILRRSATHFAADTGSNRIALRDGAGNIEVLDLLTGKVLAKTRGCAPFILSRGGGALATWDPYGKRVVHLDLTSGASSISPWPVDNVEFGAPISLAYDADANRLAIASNHVSENPVRIVRTSDGATIQTISSLMGPVAFQPDEGRFYGTVFDSHMSMSVVPLEGRADRNWESGFNIVPNSYRLSGLSFGKGPSNFFVADSWRPFGAGLTRYDRSSDGLIERWTIPGRFHGEVRHSNGRSMISMHDGGLFLFDPESPEDPDRQVELYLFSDASFAAVTGRGDYFSPPDLVRMLGFSTGNRGFSFEQFDLLLNRPDKVFRLLGASPTMISGLSAWREERLRKMGIDPKIGFDLDELPECRMIGKETLPFVTSHQLMRFSAETTGTSNPREWRVFVNNVPVLRQFVDRTRADFAVPLGTGRNKIEVSVLSRAGLESVRDTHYVTFRPEAPPLP
ncbi:MAG: hypothetical protein AAF357_01525, partial [Verrucomicrobiota bacterium]